MSAFDDEFVNGLCGGGRLSFSERMIQLLFDDMCASTCRLQAPRHGERFIMRKEV